MTCEQTAGNGDEVFEESGRSDKAKVRNEDIRQRLKQKAVVEVARTT